MAQADTLAAEPYAIPELAEQPEEEREAEDRLRRRNADYPRPTQGDIEEFVERAKRFFDPLHQSIRVERERRFLRDKTPEKWAKSLRDGRRFHSRLSYNEILAVVGAQTDNPPKVKISPEGAKGRTKEGDRDKASFEQRWCQYLLPALERKAGPDGLRRMWVDAQSADGLVAYELYLDSDAYDAIDTSPQLVFDAEHGRERYETDEEVMERTDEAMRSAEFPIGMRVTIADALLFDRDENGDVRTCAIVENKPRPLVREAARKRGYYDAIDKLDIPGPYSQGVPWQGGHGQRSNPGGDADYCETIRFYDRRWYAYIVDGKVVDGPREHHLPGVPVFIGPGIVTSSPNIEDRYQGICAGLGSIEVAVNDFMTLALDEGFLLAKPKYVVETPPQGDLIFIEGTQKSERLDLDSEGVQQLNPGQKLVNALADHNPFLPLELFGHLLGFWGKNTLNPVAMGQSPGADAAGYTVSALQDSAWTKYRDNINTEARVLEKVVDFVRRMIRDTIRDKVWLSVPMDDGKEGGTEWLALGPDDITDTPCKVTINPFTEQQKYQRRQSLMEGNERGFVPRSMVMRDGYDIEDVGSASDELIMDAAEQMTSQWAITTAMEELRMTTQPAAGVSPLAGLVDPQGRPLDQVANEMRASGAMPSDPNAPSVGAEASAASQDPFARQPGPGGMSASEARGGQPSNYTPPNRRE